MASEFGTRVTVSLFGESHGPAVGAVVSGLPAGERVDEDELRAFMLRRRGGGALTTARREADEVAFLSGVKDGYTCGTPLTLVIYNRDFRSADYESLRETPRPGHADFTARARWGQYADLRGGGHLSGRLTAPICAAGGIARQILIRRGVFAGAHLLRAAGVGDEAFGTFPSEALFEEISRKPLPVISDAAGEEMARRLEEIRAAGDSAGGVVECAVIGLSEGLGGPLFDGVENRMARAFFGIPAVKGVEFGSGFSGADALGSENNDEFTFDDAGRVRSLANRAGGILGGITTGMPVVARVAFKPTPSIAKKQNTVNLVTGARAQIEISGRHDPCVAIRAVPAVEAVCALVALDLMLEG